MEFEYFGPNSIDISLMQKMLIDENGRPRIGAASVYRQFSREQLMAFGHDNALYQFPTFELIAAIKSFIIGKTIEVGAGNAGIGSFLEISMTDSYEQEKPDIALFYLLAGQPRIKYNSDVEKITANDAVKKYRPDTVVGCWVTEDYRPQKHGTSKVNGVRELEFFSDGVKRYIFVGNEKIHGRKSILDVITPTEIKENWIVSRASDQSKNLIWIFDKP